MRPIAVDREDAYLMEIKQGMFWYNTELTKYSLREVGVRYKISTVFWYYISHVSTVSHLLGSIENSISKNILNSVYSYLIFKWLHQYFIFFDICVTP